MDSGAVGGRKGVQGRREVPGSSAILRRDGARRLREPGIEALPRDDRPAARRTQRHGQLDPTALPLRAGAAAELGADAGQWRKQGALLSSMSSVEALVASGDLSSIQPPIPRALWPMVSKLLDAYRHDGPLGAYGPASARGAVGDQPWNPSVWMRAVGDWRGWSRLFTLFGGPASELGALGGLGPDSAWAKAMLASLPLGEQLLAGGLLTALGPEGALGAKSALGILGPVGAHGFAPNDDGDYVSRGEVVRRTDVRHQGARRTHELVELHSERYAEGHQGDASWVVRGRAERLDLDGDTFHFTSGQDQIITLTAIPDRLGDTFRLELLDERGRVLGTSDSRQRENWIQVQVDRGRKLAVRITRMDGDDLAAGPGRADPLVHPMAAYLDWALAPLLAWGEAVTPELRRQGMPIGEAFPAGGYRLCCVPAGPSVREPVVTGAHQQRVEWQE